MLNAKAMFRRMILPTLGGLAALLFAGVARAQYGQHPLLDAAANKTIHKYVIVAAQTELAGKHR
jgi:hypothetical protein